MSTFSEMLRYLRKREHLTQSDIADKLGISKSAISMYENGNREPDFETLEAFADFFNVNMSLLLGDKKNDLFYLDPEAQMIAQDIYENPELRLLFDAARDADPEDLKATHDVLLALKRRERGEE